MSVLVNKDTRVVVSGITGAAGGFHAKLCMEYGTKIVAGVTPGKGGNLFENKVPVFNTLRESVDNEGANACAIFVPPPFAADAILEAIDAKIPLIVCITEGIPVKDMSLVKARLNDSDCVSRLIGPNCPGVITPEECKIGIMPGYIHRKGNIGIVSRSGTLTYEAVWQTSSLGYGQSTCIGIGGDPINGTGMVDAIKMFNDDPETEAIIMIGEIGGMGEQRAATWVKANCKKPVAAFIAGSTAPKGKRMGHAGAIIAGKFGSASDKIAALEDAGIAISPTPSDIAKTLIAHWKNK